MNRRIKVTAAAVAVIAILGSLLISQSAQSAIPGRTGKTLGRLADTPIGRFFSARKDSLTDLRDQLNITGDQRETLRGIVESHRNELAPEARTVSEKRRVLREAVMNGTPESIRQAGADLGAAIGDCAVVVSNIVREAKGALTPEQIETLKKFKADSDSALDGLFEEMAQ